MKFKVLKGTDLFKKLDDFRKEMVRCNKLAFDIVEELGYKQMRGKYNTIAGGISSIVIDGTPPANWKQVGYKEYFPMKRKVNKELLDRIAKLPVVDGDDLNKILKYNPFNRKDPDDRRMSFHPGINWGDAYILIDVSNGNNYKQLPDMIEILDSEFSTLTQALKKSKKK